MPKSSSYVLMLSLVVVATAAVAQASPPEKSTIPSPAPLRIHGLDVQSKGRVSSLGANERLQPGQDFAVRVTSDLPLYLYVLLEHANSRQALVHPRPNAPPAPASGTQRLPHKGDWFFLDKVERGDRLCLIGSERPLSPLTCEDDSANPARDRGEDSPPPPQRTVTAPPPPPPPPPADKDAARGRKKWVILLPLAAP